MNSIAKMFCCLALVILFAGFAVISIYGENPNYDTNERTICVKLKVSDIEKTLPGEWDGYMYCALYQCRKMHITVEPLCIYARTEYIEPTPTGMCNNVPESSNYRRCDEETIGDGCESCIYAMHVGSYNKHCKIYPRIYRCCRNGDAH